MPFCIAKDHSCCHSFCIIFFPFNVQELTRMSDRPWFPFYPSDWLGSVRISLLKPCEEGAYVRLLCAQWTMPNGCLPQDKNVLQKLAKWEGSEHEFSERILTPFFQPHPMYPGLVNPRLFQEWEKMQEFGRRGKRGATARWRNKAKTKPPKPVTIPPSVKPKKDNGLRPFPDEWSLTDRETEQATLLGLNPPKEFARFRDHHKAKGTKFKDWSAAWRNWTRRAHDFNQKGHA